MRRTFVQIGQMIALLALLALIVPLAARAQQSQWVQYASADWSETLLVDDQTIMTWNWFYDPPADPDATWRTRITFSCSGAVQATLAPYSGFGGASVACTGASAQIIAWYGEDVYVTWEAGAPTEVEYQAEAVWEYLDEPEPTETPTPTPSPTPSPTPTSTPSPTPTSAPVATPSPLPPLAPPDVPGAVAAQAQALVQRTAPDGDLFGLLMTLGAIMAGFGVMTIVKDIISD